MNFSNLIRLFKANPKTIGSLIFLLIVNLGVVYPQSIRVISTKDGLPQSFVSGLVQDASSFVWMGTRNGLARFDGIQYKIFQHNSRDTASVASNLIIWIERDRRNQLWIEYESGEIDVMDPAAEKIHHFLKGNLSKPGRIPFIRRGWLVDQDEMFWGIIKGGGLICYDNKTKKTTFFTHQNSALSCDTVRGLLEHRNKGIWILNQREICLFDKRTKKFSHWQIPFKQDYGNFTDVNAVAVDLHQRRNGELIWGDRHSLFLFNPASHTFRTVLLPSISYLGIRWIRTGPDGFDYFETFGKVYRYTDATGLTLIGKTVTKDPGQVKSFLVDDSGLIWIGTNGGGIQQIDLATPFFQSLPYKKDFSTDMLLQELGINMQQTFNWTLHNNLGSASYNFRSSYDARKRLYMALENTICYYDIQQKQVTKLPLLPQLIGGITFMPDGSPMAVEFSNAILTYNFSNRLWEAFVDSATLSKKLGTLSVPLDIIADEKNVWITTTNDGLLKIDIKTKHIVQLKENPNPGSIAANQLLGLRADPKRPDLLWIGSYQGLICLNKVSMKCEVFSQKDGLPDNTIYSILSDRAGNLWLSTNKGICRFDPVSHHTQVFHVQNGLPDEEFNRFHHFELPDGRLIFGGIGGWTIFNPLLMKNDEFEPAVALTDLKINNKEADESGKNDVLKSSLNSLGQLVLPFDQNTISVGFAGLEFSQPQDLQYRYRLVNYDNDWISAGSSHQANYTKIPPGDYTLLIDASNNADKWSSHLKSLKIRIRPPWWATGMAYFCYVIILSGLVWMFIRFRVNRALMKREIDMHEKETLQLKELDEMKSRFFSNITHEFRTPLTLILGPAEQLKAAHQNDPQQTRLADTIASAARQLLALINHLMELFKLEARALKLHEQRGNPASLVGAVVQSFENDAQTRQIKLLFQNKTSPVYCWFYADALERIVFNLVSNALKFTPRGGQVEVFISVKDDLVELQVADNGPGIPKDKLPYIFDRFYQAAESPVLSGEQNSGTGIGLSIVKELVSQMEGEIQAESNTSSPTGTIFTLSMPCRVFQDNLSPDPELAEQSELLEGDSEREAKRAQILLVEDSEELAAFITGILSEQFQVTHVLNGALGYDRAVSVMPDLIISDVMMPVMDGFEFCDHLKNDIRTSHIPVILLTAKVSKEDMIEGLTKGADDYLTKPFYPTELLLRIQNLFSRQEKLRAHFSKEFSRPGADAVITDQIPQDIFITRLYELLDENLDDSMFGVDQLVDLMNLSRSSLHRKIKSLTGMSTTEIVRNYRLKKASLFLLEGHNSSETAYKAGFGSPAYFTKSFREVYNITPGDFVIQNKSGNYTS